MPPVGSPRNVMFVPKSRSVGRVTAEFVSQIAASLRLLAAMSSMNCRVSDVISAGVFSRFTLSRLPEIVSAAMYPLSLPVATVNAGNTTASSSAAVASPEADAWAQELALDVTAINAPTEK